MKSLPERIMGYAEAKPEANPQRRGDRSPPSFSCSLASSGSLVAPPHPRKEEKTNHIRHHQPRELTVRESRAGPDFLPGGRNQDMVGLLNHATHRG